MKINDQLHLVVPVLEGPPSISAFHTPISREVFEANYRILAATKAALAAKGPHYQAMSGPQIARLVLLDEGRREALEQGDEEGDAGASATLNEIKRLTMILAPGDNGWERLPVDAAMARGLLDDEDWDEALSQLVFFTCHYWLAKKSEREAVMEATANLLAASLTPSSVTAYCASLPTSTESDSTPETSSVPS